MSMKDRPWGYYVVYMHTKPVFARFHEVLEVIFDIKVPTVISLLGFYFEIVNLNEALT